MAAPIPDPLADLAGLEGVGSTVMAARDAVDAVLRDRGRRRVRSEQQAEALLRAARASAELDDLDHAATRQEWEAATIRLYVELVDLSGLVRMSPGQAIARAHAVLARGLLADDDLGRIRADAGVADRMAALGRLLTAPTAAPVIVVAAIAHAELISIEPFVAGNGVVARAVEHMILINGDLDAAAVTVPEVGHLEAGENYHRALDGYRTGSARGVRDWLLHVAAAVTRGAELSPLRPVRQAGPRNR